MLSKSQYIRGLQCQKSLWLYKNKPELRKIADKAQESLFNTGNTVGVLAKQLFPNGIEIEFDGNNFNAMISKTKELIDNDTDIIYEAAFKEDGMFVMADILVKNGSKWDIYEIKGSTSVKDYHMEDTSVQWFTLSKILTLNKAYVVHIDNSYTRKGELNVHELFNIEDITDIVINNQDKIKLQILEFETMIKNDMPNIDISKHCDSPHSCDFSEHCWKHIPSQDSIFNISYARGIDWKLYKDGIFKIDDIPDDYKLNDRHSFQVKHHKSKEIFTDKPKIKEFLETIEYPINFFDFETFQNAIPRFDNQRPYAQMTFQYSLHILHKDGTLEHKEFLGDENSDPREKLAIKMLKDITPTGSIIAFNQGFEKAQIKNLSEFQINMKDDLLALNERFVDIAHPFQHKHYYHPKFNGKYSIKIVLPTLFPDNDELDYKKLGSIQNGGDAMDTFANLHLIKDKSNVEKIRKDLLAYCHLDTLAMVRIWEKLHEVIKKQT